MGLPQLPHRIVQIALSAIKGIQSAFLVGLGCFEVGVRGCLHDRAHPCPAIRCDERIRETLHWFYLRLHARGIHSDEIAIAHGILAGASGLSGACVACHDFGFISLGAFYPWCQWGFNGLFAAASLLGLAHHAVLLHQVNTAIREDPSRAEALLRVRHSAILGLANSFIYLLSFAALCLNVSAWIVFFLAGIAGAIGGIKILYDLFRLG